MIPVNYVLIMVFACLNCAASDDCDFELTTNESVIVSRHSPFILSCDPQHRIDSDVCQGPYFNWKFRGSNVLPQQGKIKSMSHGHKLIVFNADQSDEGRYVCESFNDRGAVNKTFDVTLTESNAMQNAILPNIVPLDPSKEQKGRIYWLPEMLMDNPQQNLVRNPGERIELNGAYFISADQTDIKNFTVEWFFYTSTLNRTNVDSFGYKAETSSSPCKDLDILPRIVNGTCYSNRLFMNDLNINYQGHYQSVAQVVLKSGIRHQLNFTYRININMLEIFGYHRSRKAQMNFNQDSQVCLNDNFSFNCKASPDGLFFTVIYKADPMSKSNYSPLSESQAKTINITNDLGKVLSNGVFVFTSEVIHTIRKAKMSDAGTYECKAVHMSLLNDNSPNRLETVHKMKLTVNRCTDKFEYLSFVWTGVSIIAFIIILVGAMFIYRYYFNLSGGYLVKTVIVQHPNKLYVPHDTSFPLLIPEVTIKTTHKHMSSSKNSLLQHKHSSRINNIPLSQKISKYLRKSFIFSYRQVDLTGSGNDSQQPITASTEPKKLSSHSLKVEAPRPQLVLQNDSHTKYILPSNIGWIFSRDSLVIGSKIGEGAFGIVYAALIKSFSNSSAPVEVAIKTLHTSFGDEDVINLIQELEMMKMIGHHRHIISLYGACVDNGHPYMVIELAKHGNLRDFLRARRSHLISGEAPNGISFVSTRLTLGDLLRFSLQIADGMTFLSSRMIIHRDLAARNVLVDQYLDVKIADFGLTRAVEQYYRKKTDGRLPIKWMAPECLLDRIYTVKSDVWSFGIVLWEIFSLGQTPYPTIQSDAMHQAIRNGVRNEKPILASDELYRLMLTIWNDDPVERHSFPELVDKLNHIQLTEGGISIQRDYLEISSNQCYSITNV